MSCVFLLSGFAMDICARSGVCCLWLHAAEKRRRLHCESEVVKLLKQSGFSFFVKKKEKACCVQRKVGGVGTVDLLPGLSRYDRFSPQRTLGVTHKRLAGPSVTWSCNLRKHTWQGRTHGQYWPNSTHDKVHTHQKYNISVRKKCFFRIKKTF